MVVNMKKQALELFEKGYNCAQAIAIAYGKEYGLDKQTIADITSSFGAGLSGNGEVCGALLGASMILGLRYKENSNSHVRNLTKNFKKTHKGLSCRTLLTEDFPVIYKIHSKRCMKLVEEVCDLLEQELFP